MSEKLQRDEYYYMFIRDLSLEITSDAIQSFGIAECDESYRPHFLADLVQAIQANARAMKNAS